VLKQKEKVDLVLKAISQIDNFGENILDKNSKALMNVIQ
jgi:hypothetical protein